jgi:hypothetical protein
MHKSQHYCLSKDVASLHESLLPPKQQKGNYTAASVGASHWLSKREVQHTTWVTTLIMPILFCTVWKFLAVGLWWTEWQIFSEYCGFPCRSSFHRLFHARNYPSSASSTVGQIMTVIPSDTKMKVPSQDHGRPSMPFGPLDCVWRLHRSVAGP